MFRNFNIKFTILFFILFYLTAHASTIRIMPLGDSITYDNSYSDTYNPRPTGMRSAYRNYLWYKLTNAKLDVDFVGSRVAGQDITPVFDPENEGYPGWTSYQIADKTYSWMLKSRPDIVLLHAGSNDWNTSPKGIEKILNEIDKYEQNSGNSVTVIVALIINRKSYMKWISTFNSNVNAMAKRRISDGDNIVIVDMEKGAGINYSTEMVDGAHPSNSGYEKMATVWFNALTQVINDINSNKRMLADVDGDGMQDIVGFGAKGVYVSLSTGRGFTYPSLWVASYGTEKGWKVGITPRVLADVNGDGMQDIVGFGAKGVYVSLSTGRGFKYPSLWVASYGTAKGWKVGVTPRVLADVDGDGMQDIVGFGAKGVYVSPSTSDYFLEPNLWVNNFGGW